MIRISRSCDDENGNAIQPSSQWFEQASFATKIAIQEKGNHEADSDIYGHNEVRAALLKLFHDKCAYCETKAAPGFDWDVEHYRPKGSVAERKEDHPGYYWLAYEWENLYPACTHCNQRRSDRPRWGDMQYGRTGGKADQFPLKKESDRAMSESDDLSKEYQLLIDPCNLNPERYINYTVMGTIIPKRRSKRGEATIDICHLDRRTLQDARRPIIKAAIDMVKLIRKCQEIGERTIEQELEKFVEENIIADHCPHAGAARAVLKKPENFGL